MTKPEYAPDPLVFLRKQSIETSCYLQMVYQQRFREGSVDYDPLAQEDERTKELREFLEYVEEGIDYQRFRKHEVYHTLKDTLAKRSEGTPIEVEQRIDTLIRRLERPTQMPRRELQWAIIACYKINDRARHFEKKRASQ